VVNSERGWSRWRETAGWWWWLLAAVDDGSAPVFSRPLFDTRVREGQSARLECRVDGRPEPRLVWSLDGVELGSSAELTISRCGSVGSLEIGDVLADDQGEYAVTASNVHGAATSVARLTVASTQRSCFAPNKHWPLT